VCTASLIHKALISVNREHKVVVCLYVTVVALLFNLSLQLSYTADRPESFGLCCKSWKSKLEVVSV